MSRRIRPPIVALLCLLGSLGLSFAIHAPRAVPTPWPGVAVAVLGAALVQWAFRLFKRRGTTHVPHGTPSLLVTDGPYRFTRNPMYLGLATLLAGIALAVGRWPMLLAPIGFVAIIDRVFIPREERKLEELFGAAYVDFKARVRRWL